jgi:sirohydrochlorin ferrochelatase
MGADYEAGSPLPARKPQGGPPLPARTPQPNPGLPARAPQAGPPLPARAPQAGSWLPPRTPQPNPGLPARTSQPNPGLPARAPQAGSGLPARAPQSGSGPPARAPQSGSGLPVRTTRYRRAGRHSSPHQLSLPSDAPTLVIAVPGEATPESEEIVAKIATVASGSCPGAAIQAGYLSGDKDSLDDVLAGLGRAGDGSIAVVVPLQAFPDPQADAAIAAAAARSPVPSVVGQPLGPHPLLSEVLHTRLAEAGLARSTRVGRISIVTAADGVIVGAAGGEAAIKGAGVVAVLLASRLTIPVATAHIDDRAAVKEAAGQLQAARVARVALAPCAIGPEIAPGALAAISAETGVTCAPPLGGHHAIGQLVAIRYGAALEDPKVASLAR